MKPKMIEGYFFGKKVWLNPLMENLRDRECMCLNCGNFKPNQPDNCQIAQSFYDICFREGTALAVTRCPVWKPKKVKEE